MYLFNIFYHMIVTYQPERFINIKQSSQANISFAHIQVVTFWEGELVDGNNFTFFTRKWEATYGLFFLVYLSQMLIDYTVKYNQLYLYSLTSKPFPHFTGQRMILDIGPSSHLLLHFW